MFKTKEEFTADWKKRNVDNVVLKMEPEEHIDEYCIHVRSIPKDLLDQDLYIATGYWSDGADEASCAFFESRLETEEEFEARKQEEWNKYCAETADKVYYQGYLKTHYTSKEEELKLLEDFYLKKMEELNG